MNFYNDYEKSLKIYKIIYYLKNFWLGSMISILFLKFVGLSDIEISVFHFIFSIFIFSLEIPTGVFSDKFGYKLSIQLSYFFLLLFFLTLLFSFMYGKLLSLFLAPIFLSLSGSLDSGASSSYTYTIFKKMKREKEYLKFTSNLAKNGMLCEGSAILIGSYLYFINEFIPYTIQAIFILLAIFLSFSLKKEPFKSNKKVFSFNVAYNYVLKPKFYLMLIVFLILFTTPLEYFHNVVNQSLFIEVGFSIPQIGIIGFISYFLASFLIKSIPFLWEKLKEENIYIFLSFISLLVFLFAIFLQSKIFTIFLTIFLYFVLRANKIIVNYSIQKRAKDQIRATTLSIINMFYLLPVSLLYIVISYTFIGENYFNSLIFSGILLYALSLVFSFFVLKKQLKQNVLNNLNKNE